MPRSMISMSLVTAFLFGCAADDERLVVLAASSLTESFTEIEQRFEAQHPDVDVIVAFDGSSSLAGQVEQGVPADVFASADQASVERVRADLADPPVVFALNRLVIAVREGNPSGVRGLADLAAADLVVVLAAPEVPAGAYAAAALGAAEVEVRAASLEQNVRAVAAKVALGEADAGIVYATDVAARADTLDPVEIDTTVVAAYPIAAVTDRGRQFVDFVTGPIGREILRARGFELP